MNAKEKNSREENNFQHRKGGREQRDSLRKERCKLRKQPGRDCNGSVPRKHQRTAWVELSDQRKKED